MAAQQIKRQIVIRQAGVPDIYAIHAPLKRVYGGDASMALGQEAIRGALNRFPEGRFVALWDEEIGIDPSIRSKRLGQRLYAAPCLRVLLRPVTSNQRPFHARTNSIV